MQDIASRRPGNYLAVKGRTRTRHDSSDGERALPSRLAVGKPLAADGSRFGEARKKAAARLKDLFDAIHFTGESPSRLRQRFFPPLRFGLNDEVDDSLFLRVTGRPFFASFRAEHSVAKNL